MDKLSSLESKCTICPYCEDQNIDIEDHFKATTSVNVHCKSCDLVTSNKECLEKHTKTVHEIARKVFACEKCNIDFGDKKYLFIHKDLDHNETSQTQIKEEIFDIKEEIEESLQETINSNKLP